MYRYKVDILQLLKDCGYNTNVLRKENILGQATITNLNQGKPIGIKSLEKVCELTGLDVGDLITLKG